MRIRSWRLSNWLLQILGCVWERYGLSCVLLVRHTLLCLSRSVHVVCVCMLCLCVHVVSVCAVVLCA